MAYRKFRADQLFTGHQMLGNDVVLITDEQGKVASIVPEADAGGDIQTLDGIISPGFINCHCHLELSHMKGQVPEHTGLIDFVYKIVTGRHFSEEEILAAISDAETAMLKGGIVAVGDICNNAYTLKQKQLHRLQYYHFTEVAGWLPALAYTRFSQARDLADQFSLLTGLTTGQPAVSLSPHAPYSVSEPLWLLLKEQFSGKTITIHNQETAAEDELFISGHGDFTRMYDMMKLDTSFFSPTGKTSLQSFFHHLADARQLILVHNTFTGEADIQFAQSQHPGVNWCLCIQANLYIENAIPPVELLRKNDCRIVVGTDSLASNHSLSILDELKTLQRLFPHIMPAEMLRWATYNGARALQMNNELGSFETGKTPGIIHIQQLAGGRLQPASTVHRLL